MFYMPAIKITQEPFGKLKDGCAVTKYTLTNASGAYVSFVDYGGHIVELVVPDASGKLSDIVLGYDTIDTVTTGGGYMNALVGRYANRIGGASFELDGKVYTLAANNGANHLHGGIVGFDKRIWTSKAVDDGVELCLVSEDGDEGYPGTLSVSVIYRWSEDNALTIEYAATCDKRTIMNLTNHAYFNLAGLAAQSLATHEIRINADAITPVSSPACIPTGELMRVDGTPFDLRSFRNIREGLEGIGTNEQMKFGNGYDHNFVLNGKGLREACVVRESSTGREMVVTTDAPGVQFYSGNSIKGDTIGKAGRPYAARQGFCLETQNFPDSIHHAAFPSPVLSPGETYRTTTRFSFGVRGR